MGFWSFLCSVFDFFINPIVDRIALRTVQYQNQESSKVQALSTVSNTFLKKLKSSLGLRELQNPDDLRVGRGARKFTAFAWGNQNENDGIDRAFHHLGAELTRLGLLTGGFKLYNTHASRSLLDCEGQLKNSWGLTGSSDFVIAPDGYSLDGVGPGICVLFEIKSKKQMATKGIDAFAPQGVGELIAARCTSAQPNVMVFVTDLEAVACEFTFAYHAPSNTVSITKTNVSLFAMVDRIGTFLAQEVEADVYFDVKRNMNQPRPKDMAAVTFITDKMNPEVNDVLDNFREMFQDAQSASERAEICAALFRYHDVEVPAILSHVKEDYQHMYC